MSRYVFIDQGETPEDEPVAVGPFDTEAEAVQVGQGRTVRALWSPDEWLEASV